MPEGWNETLKSLELREALGPLGLLIGTVILGLILHRLAFSALTRWSRSTETRVDDSLATHLQGPMRLVIPLLTLVPVLGLFPFSDDAEAIVRRLHTVALATAIVWLLLRTVAVVEEALLSRFHIESEDNLEARAVTTQVKVFKNLASFVIIVVGTGAALMTFPAVQRIGASILASAGVAGVVIGFAAQKSIATAVAGVQIAITQPIRLDDVVIVEGEWGRIEEITLTYVVVRIWDLRRLVVPITYFIEKPFQNWTRSSSNLLGTVTIHADYTLPVEAIRTKLKEILDDTELWDGETWGLIVLDATERTLLLRALMSAADSGKGWELRCLVRERLVEWLQREHPAALPQTRVELEELPAAKAA